MTFSDHIKQGFQSMKKRSAAKKNPNIQLLWPTPILTKKFGQHQKVNKELMKIFTAHRNKLEKKKKPMFVSEDNIYALYKDEPAIQKLVKFIMDGVFEIGSEVNGPYWKNVNNLDIQITGLWFQMTNGHKFQETHVHGNCSWSGVYYVNAADSDKSPDDVAKGNLPNGVTRFYGPNMEASAGGHGEFGNVYLQDVSYDSYPEDGKLVVFPPHLKHMPFPYAGEEDRVIVSFHAQIHNPDGFKYGYTFS